jgi:phosphoribosylcarboxyaminoimidazole (NCAIR) mutase
MASATHGVVTRTQLLRAGVTVAEIRTRLGRGALIPFYRGVYLVGHSAPSVEAGYLAAVRACGEGALLCGGAAAHLLGILHGAPLPPEVVAPTERRVAGVKTRRSRLIDPRDATVRQAIPVTTVAYTLCDIAALLAIDDLARACHEAGVRYRTAPADVDTVLARRGAVPGARKLRRVLHGEVPVTLSRLESSFLVLLAQSGLPLPLTNRLAGGRRVDCRWPEYRLTVELDGYRYHHSRHAWEQDRRREREARARGDEFRRYTYGDVMEHPRLMLRELRALLPHPHSCFEVA